LLLRGSREFATEAAYEAFLVGVLQAANRSRADKLAQELAVMKRCPHASERIRRGVLPVVLAVRFGSRK